MLSQKKNQLFQLTLNMEQKIFCSAISFKKTFACQFHPEKVERGAKNLQKL